MLSGLHAKRTPSLQAMRPRADAVLGRNQATLSLVEMPNRPPVLCTNPKPLRRSRAKVGVGELDSSDDSIEE